VCSEKQLRNELCNSFSLFLHFTFFISCLVLTSCNRGVPLYWHSNGTIIKDIVWEIPIADSATVLKTDGTLWKLPQPPDSTTPQITYTTYRTPRFLSYMKFIGRIDQEVVHSNDTNTIEFYRFENGDVLLLGFVTPDTLKPLTIFEPPLVIIPSNLKELEKKFASSGTMKTWNRNKFDDGFKSTYSITKKSAGRFLTEVGTERSVVLCENTFSRDVTMQYGQTNLIVPDAVTLTSNSVLDEEKGVLLEWGIRSRNVETKPDKIPDRDRELYIEITLHGQN
jgi:hypothetical protein